MSSASRPTAHFDPDFRLLSEEDPATPHVEDARRWIDIYARLIEFKQHLLNRVRAQPRDSHDAIEMDALLAEVQLNRLRSRLAFWQLRHRELAPLDIDERRGIVRLDGHSVHLTRREAQLLEFLLGHPGRYFDSITLAAEAWKDPNLAAEQVRTYVVRLRRKLSDAEVPCELKSERRRGYALFFPSAAEA